MRLFMINVLASAVVLFAAAQAGAVTITMAGTGGVGFTSDLIVLTLNLNNSGEPGIAVLGFSIQYDSDAVSFVSANQKKKILTNAQNENAYPTNTNVVTRIGSGPIILNGNELLFTWQNVATNWHENSNLNIATATFHANTSGVHLFTVGAFTGATLGFNSGTYASPSNVTEEIATMTFIGSGSITIVPEPTTALLIGLGLVGLGVAGSRGRQER